MHEDLDEVPRWAAYLRRASALDGPPSRGARVKYELELPGGLRTDLILEYTDWDRPRRAVGRFGDEGRTDLLYEMDYELRGLLRFAGGALKGQYADGIRRGMAMLKEYVEEG